MVVLTASAPYSDCTVPCPESTDPRGRGRRIALVIQPLNNATPSGNCHILYIAGSEKKRYQKIIKSVSFKAVLTISGITHFGRSGGVIELFREKDRIRFIINLNNAIEAGLVISSRLLSLAVVIEKEEER
jgi:hypothetical protein